MLKFQYYKLLRSPEGAKESIVRFCNWFWFRNVGYIYGIARICNILSNRQVSKGIFSCCGYWQYYWKNIVSPSSFISTCVCAWENDLSISCTKIYHEPFTISDLFSSHIFTILKSLLQSEVYVLIGMTIFGVVFGVVSYFVVHYLYEKNRKLRLKNRKKRVREPLVQI